MIFHLHKWSKWQVVRESPIAREGATAEVGKAVIQQRVCEKCGYVKIDIQRVFL